MKYIFREKPIEYIASFTLIVGGVGATFLSESWAPPLGGVLTAVGGALLSYTASSVKRRMEAQDVLGPELQSISRHLADTIAKLSKVTQSFEANELDPELAIDRVSQLRSTFYASLHDLNLLSGSTTNFESLVETVEVCEQTAAKLADLTKNRNGLENIEEINKLREQLSIARGQLQQLSSSYTSPPTKKENVSCPYCGGLNEANISVMKGPGVTLACAHCMNRFHAHRLDNGSVHSVPWGGDPTKMVVTNCPKCHSDIPINFKKKESKVIRFCLNCCERLEVKDSGEVLSHESTNPVESTGTEVKGNRYQMTCPKCLSTVPSLYVHDSRARGVCLSCQHIVESPVAEQSTSPDPYSAAAP